ncbi:cytosine permease [Cereibacter sp. SYSU M97828]|nr:cytosine permease [Cereibacter flavus]
MSTIEENSVGFVPLGERHGRAHDLFTLWFTTNIAPLPIVTGAMAVQVFDLPLIWAATAIVFGNIVGALILGACSAQGPQMGLAQMIQSRGQFGRYGALLVVGFATLLYLGFFTSNIVLAAKSVHALMPAINTPSGAVISALAAAIIAIMGYRTIHLLNRVGMWFMGIGLLAAGYNLVTSLPEGIWTQGEVTVFGWFSMFSLAAVWHLSYACYTSDYSRYLPPQVGIRAPMLASFGGAATGTSASFMLGAIAVAGAPAGADAMEIVSASVGVLAPVLLLLFILNIVAHNALNIYGAVLSLITVIQTFAANWEPARRARIVMSIAVLLGCLAMATLTADFVPRFISFVIGLMIVLAPWVTINILDFYVVKRGRYDIASFFRHDGGIYGKFQLRAAIAYFLGIACQIPMLNTPFYTGPVARAIGEVDIGWLVAFIVTGIAYFALAPSTQGAAALAPLPSRR